VFGRATARRGVLRNRVDRRTGSGTVAFIEERLLHHDPKGSTWRDTVQARVRGTIVSSCPEDLVDGSVRVVDPWSSRELAVIRIPFVPAGATIVVDRVFEARDARLELDGLRPVRHADESRRALAREVGRRDLGLDPETLVRRVVASKRPELLLALMARSGAFPDERNSLARAFEAVMGPEAQRVLLDHVTLPAAQHCAYVVNPEGEVVASADPAVAFEFRRAELRFLETFRPSTEQVRRLLDFVETASHDAERAEVAHVLEDTRYRDLAAAERARRAERR
jgi:hypothetical protein